MLVVTTDTVLGYPAGAPTAACSNIRPNHTNPSNMATGLVPFTINIINLTNNSYVPGQIYTSKQEIKNFNGSV